MNDQPAPIAWIVRWETPVGQFGYGNHYRSLEQAEWACAHANKREELPTAFVDFGGLRVGYHPASGITYSLVPFYDAECTMFMLPDYEADLDFVKRMRQ